MTDETEGQREDERAAESEEASPVAAKSAPRKASAKKPAPKSDATTAGAEAPKASSDERAARSTVEAPSEGHASDDDEELVLRGEAWAHPLVRLEHRWTSLETGMLTVALGLLVGTLCLWFAIRGMKDPVATGSPAGTVWRALVGMSVLGGLTRFASGKLGWEERQRSLATLGAIVVGALLAKSWRTVGIVYFENLLDWLQQGSSLSLFGGLKGISTRLTMLVSLIGASLACSTGTHINIDVVVRFIPKSWRKGAHQASLLGAAVVCLVSSWGFFDFIAVSSFRAKPEASAGEKVGHVAHELGHHLFALRKQLGLDLGALPTVLGGGRWNADERMNGAQWNAFLDESGYVERFGAEKVAGLRATSEELTQPRRPFVVLPDEATSGVLLHSMNLLFAVGFFMIGLRMLLRLLLVQSGHISLEEEADPEDDGRERDASSLTEEEAA